MIPISASHQATPDPARVLTKATLRAAQILGLSHAKLAQVLGVSAPSVSRMQSEAYVLPPNSKEWELATLLIRLYRGLDAIMAGDEQAVAAWMKNDNTDLHAKPHTLVSSITGLVNLVSYVDAHRARV